MPDEEVVECQLCGTRFGTVVTRKHHCRQCGRVVCSSCSDNTIFIASLGRKDRACDRCADLSRHDKSASLTESVSANREAEVVLKASLKEMTEQCSWFQDFLKRVAEGGARPDHELPSPSASPPASAAAIGGTNGGDAAGRGRSASALEGRARLRWKQVFSDLRNTETENERLARDSEQLEGRASAHASESVRLRQVLASLESDLRDGVKCLPLRDQLARKTATLQQELDGLRQRAQTLQADMPVAGGSWSFTSSPPGGSFTMARDPRDPPGQTCVERVRRCNVM